jgi:hypothetical protein
MDEPATKLPDTPYGVVMFHHLSRPDDYGYPTDEQLAQAIRRIEKEARDSSKKFWVGWFVASAFIFGGSLLVQALGWA